MVYGNLIKSFGVRFSHHGETFIKPLLHNDIIQRGVLNMGNRGKSNGTIYYDCPFCGEMKGYTNLQGRVSKPAGFPEILGNRTFLNSHTVKCWEQKGKPTKPLKGAW